MTESLKERSEQSNGTKPRCQWWKYVNEFASQCVKEIQSQRKLCVKSGFKGWYVLLGRSQPLHAFI